MSAPSYPTTGTPISTTIANPEVSAGNYTATNAKASTGSGNANGRTRIKKVQVRAAATTAEDEIRVYRKQGSAYTYLFSFYVPVVAVAFPNYPPWISEPVYPDLAMASGDTLAYNHQLNNGTLTIEEEWKDF